VSNKFEEKGIKYLNIDIEDTPEYKISKYFQIAFHFIDEALSLNNDFFQPLDGNSCCFNSENDVIPEDWEICLTSSKDLLAKDKIIQDVCKSLFYPKECTGRVLVHCSLGASRSTTIAIMYIMKKFKLCFEDALSLMCLHREKCAPIDSFVEELKQFEMNDFEFNKDSIN
jgi:protein-tyrosine phosphatase